MAKSGKCSVKGTSAAVSGRKDIIEREKEILRHEFEVMRKLGFALIEDIGASDAEEYIVKITDLVFLHKEHGKKK